MYSFLVLFAVHVHPRATPTLPFHTHLVLENMLDSAPPRRLLKGGAYDATQDAPALIDGCAHHLRVLQFLNKVPVLLAASNAVYTASTFPKLFFSIPSLASSTYFRTWPLAFTACRTKPRSRCNFVLQNLKALPHWATASSVRSESPRRSEEANLWCAMKAGADCVAQVPSIPNCQITVADYRSLREAAYGSRMVKILQGKAILPHCRQSYGLQKGPDELPPTRSNKPTPVTSDIFPKHGIFKSVNNCDYPLSVSVGQLGWHFHA